MPSYNRVTVMGNVTRDLELRYTPSGTAVCDVGLAINERVKQGDGTYKEVPVFVDITLWGRTAEVACEYLKKGDPTHIEGRLKFDQWVDKQTGGNRSKLAITGERLQLIGTKRDAGGESGGGSRASNYDQTRSAGPREHDQTPQPQASAPSQAAEDDDIPF